MIMAKEQNPKPKNPVPQGPREPASNPTIKRGDETKKETR